MDSPQKNALRRTACDRCRSQRLKCIRDEGQFHCQRCLRLGKTCAMGEARRPGRPRKTHMDISSLMSPQSIQSFQQDVTPTPFCPEPAPQTEPTPVGRDVMCFQEDLANLAMTAGDCDGIFSFVNDRSTASPLGFNFPGTNSIPSQGAAQEGEWPKLDQHGCLKELSQLNVELNAQWRAIQTKGDAISLKSYICLPPPSYFAQTSNAPVIETSLTMCQRFLNILSSIDVIMKQTSSSPIDHHISALDPDLELLEFSLGWFGSVPLLEQEPSNGSHEPGNDRKSHPPEVDTPLVLLIISCYIQLVNIFTNIFFHVHDGLKGLNEPVPPLEFQAIKFGTFSSTEGGLQGIIFCTVVTHYFDRIEKILGLLPDTRRQIAPIHSGLLTRPHHLELLKKELESQGASGCRSSTALRDTVEEARCLITALPS